jgi:hypothetical protein
MNSEPIHMLYKEAKRLGLATNWSMPVDNTAQFSGILALLFEACDIHVTTNDSWMKVDTTRMQVVKITGIKDIFKG